MRWKWKQRSQLLIAVICLIVYQSFTVVPVKAGGLNGDETRVVGVLSGTFTYNGVEYKADSSYLSMAIGYLSQDDVDLTAEQCNEAISTIYNNVGTAVESGYLVPIKNEEPAPEEEEKPEDEEKEDTQQPEENDDKTVQPGDNQSENPVENPETKNSSTVPNQTDGNSQRNQSNSEQEQNNHNIENTGESEKPEDKIETKDDQIEASESSNVNTETEQEETKEEKKSSVIVKQTGFSFVTAFRVSLVLGVIFIALILFSIYTIFAKRHEEKL